MNVSDDGPASFISTSKVTEAIKSFGDFKAPGPDGIQPFILKKLGFRATERLVAIFRASYLLGKLPSAWLQSKVIFLPKPGKDSYSVPRSFRPITLSSFLTKTLERVIYWHLVEGPLRTNPLSEHQHAFRKGRSTESALSFMTSQIESAFHSKGFALGVFLDIQGAFDNVSVESIINGMRAKGFPERTIKWYSYYLRHRTMETEYQGVSLKKLLTLGTPQGGVLSPLAWSLAFESLLELFKVGPVKICGFADDGGLIIVGSNLRILQVEMQVAVDVAVRWGADNGLTFSEAKTAPILFTWNRKFTEPPPIRMNGNPIPYVSEVKYLGVTLDSKLTYASHIKKKIKAAKANLLLYRNAMGSLWGTSPKMTRWLYTGIVRPALTYAAMIWARGCKTTSISAQLTRVNRLGLLTLGHFRNGTPTAGLEIIANVCPLPLYVKKVGAAAFLRAHSLCESQAEILPVTWCNMVTQPITPGLRLTMKTGHLDFCRITLEEINHVPFTTDKTVNHYMWDKLFEVDKTSFLDGRPLEATQFDVYTDGSLKNDAVGCGGVIFSEGSEVHSFSIYLGNTYTVFQSEVYAIFQAAKWLLENCFFANVNIYVDSRAALQSVGNFRVSSELVNRTILMLNQASETNTIVLRWIKAHVGHAGNERADSLAKESLTRPLIRPDDAPFPPESYAKSMLSLKFLELWDDLWTHLDQCRQTKQWFPHPEPKKTFQLMRSSRTEFSALVQLITGFNFLRRHSALVDKTDENMCRLCDEDEETSFHIMAECSVLATIRLAHFGHPVLSVPLKWSKSRVVGFLREASIDLLELDQ